MASYDVQQPNLYQRLRHPLSTGGVLTPVTDAVSEVQSRVSSVGEDIKKQVVKNYNEAVDKIRELLISAAQRVDGTITNLFNHFRTIFNYFKATLLVALGLGCLLISSLIGIALHKIINIERINGGLALGGASINFKTLKRPTSLKHTPLEKLEEK